MDEIGDFFCWTPMAAGALLLALLCLTSLAQEAGGGNRPTTMVPTTTASETPTTESSSSSATPPSTVDSNTPLPAPPSLGAGGGVQAAFVDEVGCDEVRKGGKKEKQKENKRRKKRLFPPFARFHWVDLSAPLLGDDGIGCVVTLTFAFRQLGGRGCKHQDSLCVPEPV